jgi:tRNA nucleotidyltransferase (CCA-adding enzyme)
MNTIITRLKSIFPEDTYQRIFLVGGGVRDILLGREHTDIDLAASLTTEEFTASGFHLVQGKSTAAIWHSHFAGIGTIEVTPLTDATDLTDDLRQRDFTVNAMAMTLAGDIIDPLDGQADIKHKRLSPCSRQTFSDDPLRIFRAFRLAADDWHMTAECRELLRERNWDRDLSAIPVERFSREMLKALEKQEPERFFKLMLEMGFGQEYLPELFRMPLIPAGPVIHHPEGDLFTHSCQVLQRVSKVCDDPLTRFCALFHDLGKLATSPALYPRHHGHDQAGFGMALEFCQRLRLPAQYGKALAWVSMLHGTFNLWDQLRDATKLRVADQAIKAGIVDVLPIVAAADKAGGSEPAEWRAVVVVAGISVCKLGINVQDLEGIKPTKRPDHILQAKIKKLISIRTAST